MKERKTPRQLLLEGFKQSQLEVMKQKPTDKLEDVAPSVDVNEAMNKILQDEHKKKRVGSQLLALYYNSK